MYSTREHAKVQMHSARRTHIPQKPVLRKAIILYEPAVTKPGSEVPQGELMFKEMATLAAAFMCVPVRPFRKCHLKDM